MTNSPRILFLDIETAPHKVYVWRLFDQNVAISQIVEPGYTICWSAKWYGKKEVMFDSIMNSTMKQMVKGIYALLDEADIVVHYNGTKFDIPTLSQEFALQGLTPPSPYFQVDLLTAVRRAFKFPSNKLAYVIHALELGEKLETAGMDLWKGCMEKDAKSWLMMEKYNKRDVQLLGPLYEFMLPWMPNHPNLGLYSEEDVLVCTRCSSTNILHKGTRHTQVGIYKRYKCKDCGKWMRGRVNLRKSESEAPLLVDI